MKKDKKTEARNWFTRSQTEFEDAFELEKRGRFYLALFLYQQATEKALKAFLFLNEEEELFTHSVKELIYMAIAYDKDFEKVKLAKDLDRYYIPTRYPNSLAGNVPAEFLRLLSNCPIVIASEARQSLRIAEPVPKRKRGISL